MKKIYLLLLCLGAMMPALVQAQGKTLNLKDKTVANAEANRKTAAPYSVMFSDDAAYRASDAQQLFIKYLSLRTGTDELRQEMVNEVHGITLTRYHQYYKGIKVEHGAYTVAAKAGKVSYMLGDFYDIAADESVVPGLSEADARTKAWMYTDGAVPNDPAPAAGELVFVEKGLNDAEPAGRQRLAYKFFIDSRTKALTHNFVYVDAKDGSILFTDNQIKAGCYNADDHGHAVAKENTAAVQQQAENNSPNVVAPLANSIYSGPLTNMVTRFTGGSYRLEALLATELYPNHTKNVNHALVSTFNTVAQFNTAIAASTEITDADNSWTTAEYANANKDNTAFDVHWGAQRVYDYWKTRHGRNSWDNADGVLNCYVHGDVNWNNAFWQGSGGINSMFYGDGSNSAGGFTTLSSLDVTGHEIGHGVCQATSNLTYSNQSGAMNEGFSDIWGASIEHLYDPHETDAVAKSYFDIGEEIKVGGGALRSMSNPNLYGQPDTYLGTSWYTGTGDYGGVHTNSGVLNFWFYLIVTGKTGTNDLGNAYSVPAIGWQDAEKITFLGETSLTASANYAACRTAMINASTALFGPCSLQTEAVTKAWYAVGVGANFVTCTPQISFASAGQSVTETGTTGTGCAKTKTVTVPVNILIGASQSATVSFTITGTATAGALQDYTITPATVTFPAGSTTTQNLTVTINDDGYVEPDETIIISISSVATSGNATAAATLQQHTITIVNDDFAPALAGTTPAVSIYSEDFTAPGTFTYTNTGTNIWRLGRNTATDVYFGASNPCAYVSSGTTVYAYSTTTTSSSRLETPAINATNSSNLQLTFDYVCNGEYDGTYWDYGTLWYTTDGTNWQQINTTKYQGTTSKTTITVALPAATNYAAALKVGFQWDNDNLIGNQPPFGVDNIIVRGDTRSPAAVQTGVNTGAFSDVEYLGPNGTVNFYDRSTGLVMGTIQNLGTHDYGCTTMEVERAGTGAQFITGDASGNSKRKLSDKTFKVTPTTNNPAGSYRITLYYTAAEKAGYETASTRVWAADNGANNGTRITKAPNSIGTLNMTNVGGASAAVESAGTYGSDYTITASFSTGFSGFAVGVPPAIVVPVSLLSFTGKKAGTASLLSWQVAQQLNVANYEVEHSINGVSFANIGSVAPVNAPDPSYSFTHYKPAQGNNYYRLKMTDNDGSFRYSDVVRISFGGKDVLTVTPNPVKDQFTVNYSGQSGIRSIAIIDAAGRMVRSVAPVAGTNTITLNAAGYAPGLYLVRMVTADNTVVTQKIIKQ